MCEPSSGEESHAVGEDMTQEGLPVEEVGDEDGEDEGEDEEGEEEEKEQDLEVEPEEEEPVQIMKRPAGAGTTGKRGKEAATTPKPAKATAIPKAGKGTKAKGKGKAGAKPVVPKATPKKKGNGKGKDKNAGNTTTPPRKSRPDDLVDHAAWYASTEKKLKGELLQARSYY